MVPVPGDARPYRFAGRRYVMEVKDGQPAQKGRPAMNTLLRKDPRAILPDMIEWFEDPFFTLRPYLAPPIRVEEYTEDGRYLIKAELAGLKPEEDLDVLVGSGDLTIRAHRSGTTEGKRRSEFRYGSFTRTMPLPDNADPDDVTAGYRDGILAISVGLKTAEADEGPRKVTVKAGA